MESDAYVKKLFPYAVCRRSTLSFQGNAGFEIFVPGEDVGAQGSTPPEAWDNTAAAIRSRRYYRNPDGSRGSCAPGFTFPAGVTEITAEEFYSPMR